MNRRMERHFTEQEKHWILESRSAHRLETRVITSLDNENMNEDEGVLAAGNGYRFWDVGEAMYAFRKAFYDSHVIQREVTTARRIMRYHESRLKVLLRDMVAPVYVGGVQLSLGQRVMSPTVGTIEQFLIDVGMRPERIALYMMLRRRPKMARKVNAVRLFINGVEQRPNVFGDYRPRRR